jgi:putative membrane protein insertion efficiency factor
MQTSTSNEVNEGDRLKSVPALEFRSNAKHSIPVKAALTALRIYKVYLSILFAGNCRFQPTCSMYTYEAIERFGVMRGSWMGLKRLLRCQPLSRKFGYDPVPEKSEVMASPRGVARSARPSNAASREAHS